MNNFPKRQNILNHLKILVLVDQFIRNKIKCFKNL